MKDKEEIPDKKKREYIKPEIISEELVTFGALCNGTDGDGRKITTEAPYNCNGALLS